MATWAIEAQSKVRPTDFRFSNRARFRRERATYTPSIWVLLAETREAELAGPEHSFQPTPTPLCELALWPLLGVLLYVGPCLGSNS